MSMYIKTANRIPTSFSILLFVVLILGLGACGQGDGESQHRPVKPVFDRKKVDKGFVVFIAHCQRCHGLHAKGDDRWYKAQDDKTIPPPLNGNGKTWQRTQQQLTAIITNGAENPDIMPGFEQTLSSEDIENVMTWFKSIWPPQKFHAWKTLNQDNS